LAVSRRFLGVGSCSSAFIIGEEGHRALIP
jgi:hypothetical protein